VTTVGVVALLCALGAGVAGFAVPWLIGRLPEPAPRPGNAAEQDVEEPAAAEESPKVPYAELGARPGLGWRSAVSGAVVGGLVGAAVGPDWWLLVLVPLVPVCVALAVIDWHTKLLPTRLVLPATGLALLGGLVGWAVTQQTDDLVRALLGLVVARSVFWVLWFVHSAGMGFGDVRLAALLGLALGHLGWAELLVGVYSGFLVFGLPGLLLAVVRRDRSLLRTAFPFGPFMLAGALVGILAGPWVAAYLGAG
jgi:leader peptidase (prepilin peptidase)/N-methyltransferase